MLKRNNKNGTQSHRRWKYIRYPYQVLSRVCQNLLNNFFTEHLRDHKTQQDYKKSTTADKERFVKTVVTNLLFQRLETFFSDPPIV